MSQTVLVADDSKTIRQIVEMALKASSWEVVGVDSAQDAMQAARQSPSVILLDYYMPDGSGYDVCRALKQDSDTRSIPIVMLGGRYMQFDEGLAREAGADLVLMKPFKTDALLTALEEAQNAESALPLPTMPASEPSDADDDIDYGYHEPEPEPEPSPATVESDPGELDLDESSDEIEYGYGVSDAAMDDDSDDGSEPEYGRDVEPSPVYGVDDDDDDHLPVPEPQPRTPSEPSRGSSPDINASSRAPGIAPQPVPSGPGLSRDEIEAMIREEVKAAVKNELPGLLRNVMGEIFQQKIMPKLTEHADARINTVVNEQMTSQIQAQVRVELERLLSEE